LRTTINSTVESILNSFAYLVSATTCWSWIRQAGNTIGVASVVGTSDRVLAAVTAAVASTGLPGLLAVAVRGTGKAIFTFGDLTHAVSTSGAVDAVTGTNAAILTQLADTVFVTERCNTSVGEFIAGFPNARIGSGLAAEYGVTCLGSVAERAVVATLVYGDVDARVGQEDIAVVTRT